MASLVALDRGAVLVRHLGGGSGPRRRLDLRGGHRRLRKRLGLLQAASSSRGDEICIVQQLCLVDGCLLGEEKRPEV
ncbi:hypothetical protein CH063_05314 [Colletotrichum higginsianum]|uniref:Uncharacterized protein n=1 Tax=Colletotrichum higginsianum (strain IMI 349063) TaxID=759273 RepID=H1UYJ7_COLHI|nr:hypothetical protein CH063_05314 [Colletotrichum higginsianum]